MDEAAPAAFNARRLGNRQMDITTPTRTRGADLSVDYPVDYDFGGINFGRVDWSIQATYNQTSAISVRDTPAQLAAAIAQAWAEAQATEALQPDAALGAQSAEGGVFSLPRGASSEAVALDGGAEPGDDAPPLRSLLSLRGCVALMRALAGDAPLAGDFDWV
jgi:hypothetical protein